MISPTKLLAGASVGLALASASFAQETTSTGGGLLGVKYAEAGFGYLDVNHSDRGIYGGGANVNLPISANFDLAANFSHNRVENNGSLYQNAIATSLIGYLTEGAFRPFAAAGLGYVWVGSGDDNFGVWDVGVGVEYSLNSTTALRASVDYGDSFESDSDGNFSGTVGINHWFSDTVGGTAQVSSIEGGNVGYFVSAVFKF